MNEFWDNVTFILRKRRIPRKKLAMEIGISEPYLSELISGKARTNMPIMQKTADFLGFKLADLLSDNIAEVIARNNEIESWRNTKLYQPITPLEEFNRKIKQLGYTAKMARPLMYVPLLKGIPSTKQDIYNQNFQKGIVITNYIEGREMLFGLEVEDLDDGGIFEKNMQIICDPETRYENGDRIAIKMNNKDLARFCHIKETCIILQSKNETPPEVIQMSDIDNYSIYTVIEGVIRYRRH